MANGRDIAVFISYNSKDVVMAQALNQFLTEQLGLKTWFDETDVLGGDAVNRTIGEGVSRCLICLALMGGAGLGKYQEKEIDMAIQREIEQSIPRVIPVQLPNFDESRKWPSVLLTKSHVDLKTNPINGLNKLIRSIQGGISFPLVSRKSPTSDLDEEIFEPGSRPFNFAADVTKIVELLIGESLYSKKDVCVRELIQNAYDACVRRDIGRPTYRPEIRLNINTRQGWFEVDDNGEGMSPEILGKTFAIIGKSIREEAGVLQSFSRKRASLIAQFGVGFVSTFMISKEIVVSTKYEHQEQINFSIDTLENGFSYTDKSQCDREPNKVGTTIRVYLRDEDRKRDIKTIAETYVRHVDHFKIYKNGKKIKGRDDWNLDTAIYTKTYHGRSPKYEFELRLGASPNEGPFYASNFGFLISDNANAVMPFYTPNWILGEVNLRGAADLTVSRDSIVENEKSARIKKEIQEYLRDFLSELAKRTSEGEIKKDKKGTKRKLRMIRSQLTEVIQIYNHIWRNPKKASKFTSEDPPLTLHQTNFLILELAEFEYGGRKSPIPLGKIVERVKKLKLSEAYFSYLYQSEIQKSMSEMLSNMGYFVFATEQRKVLFRGSRKGNVKSALKDIVGPILEEHGISLQKIGGKGPEKFAKNKVSKNDLPTEIEGIFQSQMRQLAKGAKQNPVKFVKLENAPLIFKRKKTRYVNVDHPRFQDFLKWSKSASEVEKESYVRGLLISMLS